MSKHSSDPKFSPLLLLVPVPFVLAAFLPLTIDHPVPAKTEQVAVTSIDGEPAASAPQASHSDHHTGR
jgi:hypothetical protein